MSFIAIICGLKSEQAAVAKALAAGAIATAKVRIGVSGADAGRAEDLAAGFARDGARLLISVGVSGGLDPSARPGDFLIGEDVRCENGDIYPAALELMEANTATARLLGVDRIIDSAEEKAALFGQTGAVAVDMESHAVARAASRYNVQFLAFRAIADPADRVLPKAALGAVAPDGSTRIIRTLIECAKAPGDFPALLKLGSDSSKANRSLSENLLALFPGLLLRLDL